MITSKLSSLGKDIPKEEIKINSKKRKASMSLRVFFISDDDFIVAYVPSLSISAYGVTKEMAEEMLKEGLDDYFVTLFDLSEIKVLEDLREHGWESTYFKKTFRNKSYIDKDGVLKDFNLPADTPIEEGLIAA